jgi:hypothetical protein
VDDGHFGSVYCLKVLQCDIRSGKWLNADEV